MNKKNKTDQKKILMYVYKKGNFVYAEYSNKTTEKEHLAVLGIMQMVIEQMKGSGKCLH